MSRIVHTFALLVALVILVSCLWRDYDLLVSVKRVVIAYLGSFFLAAGLLLAMRWVGWNQVDAVAPATAARPVREPQESEASSTAEEK